MSLSVAVGTKGDSVGDGIGAAGGKRSPMVNLQVWSAVRPSGKRCICATVFAPSVGPGQHFGNYVRISRENPRENLNLLGVLWR